MIFSVDHETGNPLGGSFDKDEFHPYSMIHSNQIEARPPTQARPGERAEIEASSSKFKGFDLYVPS